MVQAVTFLCCARVTLNILIFSINLTYFVNVSKHDRADYSKTTKSLIKHGSAILRSDCPQRNNI